MRIVRIAISFTGMREQGEIVGQLIQVEIMIN